MTNTDSESSVWTRVSYWLTRIADTFDYDSVEFTFDRMNELNKELTELKTRVAQLENDATTNPSNTATKVAASLSQDRIKPTMRCLSIFIKHRGINYVITL